MRVRQGVFSAVVCAGLGIWGWAAAQTPAPKPAAKPAAGTAPAPRVQTDLLHLMRGIMYPASNVIFAAQTDDPATIKPAADPSTSPNPLTSVYGGWAAVENAGYALAESSNLLLLPGRMCSNGRPAPTQNADWQMWVQEMRDAGLATVKAAQARNQDAVVDAAGVVAEACAHCHDKYREVKVRC